jgi:hypothetical protein
MKQKFVYLLFGIPVFIIIVLIFIMPVTLVWRPAVSYSAAQGFRTNDALAPSLGVGLSPCRKLTEGLKCSQSIPSSI